MDKPDPFEQLRKLSEPGALLDPQVLSKVLEVLRGGVLIVDRQGILRYANHRIELLFGYERGALIGKPVEMLLPEGLHARHAEHRRKFFEDPRPRQMGVGLDLLGQRQDGTEIKLEIELTPIVVAGSGVYVVAEIWRRRGDASEAA